MANMFGHNCWQKLTFQLFCSSDLFNAKLQELYQGVDSCVIIADDIVVYGFYEDGSDHDQTLMAVLQITQANNLKFNPDKCIFCATQVSFFRHLLCGQGLKPDPNKVKCIEDTYNQQRWANYKVS